MSNKMKGETTMKKTLRLMGLCALAVLALAGCKKNEQTGTKTFKATISQLNSDARTSIGIIGNGGAVSRWVNVTDTYDFFPFIFEDVVAHFIEDVLLRMKNDE